MHIVREIKKKYPATTIRNTMFVMGWRAIHKVRHTSLERILGWQSKVDLEMLLAKLKGGV